MVVLSVTCPRFAARTGGVNSWEIPDHVHDFRGHEFSFAISLRELGLTNESLRNMFVVKTPISLVHVDFLIHNHNVQHVFILFMSVSICKVIRLPLC